MKINNIITIILLIVFNCNANENIYEKLLEKGYSCLQQKQVEKSVDIFMQAINQDSKRFEGYYYIGNAYLMGGKSCVMPNIKKSIQYLEKAIEIKPNFPDSYYSLGIAYLNINEFKKAENCFLKAYELSPQSLIGKLSFKEITKIQKNKKHNFNSN